MTTPQSELHNLSYKVNHLCKMFETCDRGDDEDTISIFEKVDRIERENRLLLNRMSLIQDQLALIIKLLGKE